MNRCQQASNELSIAMQRTKELANRCSTLETSLKTAEEKIVELKVAAGDMHMIVLFNITNDYKRNIF